MYRNIMGKVRVFNEINALYKKVNKQLIVYPTDIKKYVGYIVKLKDTDYLVVINHNSLEKPIRGHFASYDEGITFIKKMNKKHKLPIKNMVRDHGAYMKAELTQGKKMEFDKRNLKIIQKHTMHAARDSHTNNFYARTMLSKPERIERMHNIIMKRKSSDNTIDHVNRETLNNLEVNMRFASGSVQSTNRCVDRNNRMGTTGVHFLTTRNAFIVSRSGKRTAKTFSVKRHGYEKAKQMAIDHRKEIERIDPLYIEAYRTDQHGINLDENDVYPLDDDLEYDYNSLEIHPEEIV